METKQTFEAFYKELQQVLTHLFDPAFLAALATGETHPLAFLIRDESNHPDALQSLLIQEIESLKPGPEVPPNSWAHRSHNILRMRYIDKVTQEQTAEHLQMSLRSLQRAQHQAVLILAYKLWNQQYLEVQAESPSATDMWRTQLEREIKLISQHTPAAPTQLDTVLDAVKRISSARSPQRFNLRISGKTPDMMTSLHPLVLQQILLSICDIIMDRAPAKILDLKLQPLADHNISISFMGGNLISDAPPQFPLVEGLLATQQHCHLTIPQIKPLIVTLQIPSAKRLPKKVTVLFVDDNADLATLFTSYCTGTPYELVHVNQGALVQQKITEVNPDLIILDVMLPDVDGWQLLMELHANATTTAIPVIVCSVVTDAHLALDLGARSYLQKPVWRQQFLEAIQNILNNTC
jgi:CheY-like chemotaxis protein